MARFLIAMVLVFSMAASAGAVVYSNGTNPQPVTITLVIPCFTNIYWNNEDDKAIVFNDIVQNGSNGGDWYSSVLTGAYGAATKASQDAYAEGYYESYDAALFWLQSNCAATMTLTSGGDLTNGSATLPTWFTTAFTNNTNCTYNVDCGFINGGARMSDGTIPGDGMGTYGDDANTDFVMEPFGGAFYPNQYSFPMVSGGNTVHTANFAAFAEGTILFHARALRSGISDNAGTYTTTLGVGF